MSQADDIAPAVILDPSFLFEPDAVAWLEDPELRPLFRVSAALLDRLASDEFDGEWREYGYDGNQDQLRLIRSLLDGVEPFSHRQVDDLPEPAQRIRAELPESGPLGEVYADEWVFLVSQSIGLFGRAAEKTFAAFRKAGGAVHRIDGRMEELLDKGRDHLPPKLVQRAKQVGKFPHKTGPKILMFGGMIAGFLIPPLGLGLGIAGAAQQGAAIVGGDP